MKRIAVSALLFATLAATPAAGQPLDEAALADARGGLATSLGFDIGFGASVKTYVDGSLALETQLTWTEEGLRTKQSGAALGSSSGGVFTVAPGTQVVHDLTENRIASVVMNTADGRNIRQETDITLNLPQLPDLQQRIAAERLGQALQALSPEATGLGR